MRRRILALLMSALMVVQMLPTGTVYAAETESTTEVNESVTSGDAVDFLSSDVDTDTTTYSSVSTYDELVTALATGENVILADNIVAPDKATLTINNQILDLNGKTLTLNGESGTLTDSEIKNGTIAITTYEGDTVADGLFDVKGTESTITGVNFYSEKFALYAIFDLKTGDLVMDSCTIDMKNNTVGGNGGLFFTNGGGTLTMNNCTVTATDVGDFITNGTAVLSGCTITLNGTVENGLDNGINGTALTLTDTTLIVDGATGRGITTSGSDIAINGTSSVVLTNCAEGGIRYKASANITVAETASLTGTVKVDAAATAAKVNDQTIAVTNVADEDLPDLSVVEGTVTIKQTAISGEGTKENPYVIQDIDQFKKFRDNVNSGKTYQGEYVQLTAPINLNGEEWTPIGNSDNKFLGNFDGQNNVISNLVITGYNSNVGLFGFTSSGEIKNVTVNNAKVSGRLNVGVVAGTPYTTKYDNIKVTGHVEVNGMAYVGGVFGKNVYANISNITVAVDEDSYVNANSVEDGTAYRTYVGGVVGFMGEGNITVSKVTSNIDVIGSTCDIGGIAGIAHYGNTFESVTCTADVTMSNPLEAGEQPEIGGIAGVWHNGGATVTLTDCSYEGTITCEDENGNAVSLANGGLVGAAYSPTGTGEIQTDYQAYIGTTLYKKLSDAVAAVKDGETIVLMHDITISEYNDPYTDGTYDAVYYDGGLNFTIDFNGATLTTEATNAALRFKNNSGTNNEITFKNGTIESLGTAVSVGGGSSNTVLNLTDMVISTTGGTYAQAVYVQTGDTLNVENCTISCANGAAIYGNGEKTVVNVKDGTYTNIAPNASYSWFNTGLAVAYGATMNIEGDTKVSGTYTALYVFNSGGTINVNGGKFTGTYAVRADYAGTYSAKVNISTGTFDGALLASGSEENCNIIVSGGVFDQAVPEKYCGEGFTPVKNEDGTYGVGQMPNAEVINLGSITIDEYQIYDGKNLKDGDGSIDLQVAMEFLAKDTVEEATANAFGHYITDFYITIDGAADGGFKATGCYLAGHYGDFGWIMIPLDGMTIENDKVYPVITSVDLDFSYVEICTSVKDFKCGIYFSKEVIEANPDMSVTLTLGLSEDLTAAKAADFITVDQPYTYEVKDFGKEAKVTTAAGVTIGYTTLADALNAAATGDTVTLLDNVTTSDIIVIDESITLDGNGYTLNTTASRAINVDTQNGEVTTEIKNLNIVGNGSERGINIIDDSYQNTPADVTLTNVDISGVSVYGVQIANSVGSGNKLTITNSKISSWIALNNNGDNQTVTVTGSDLIGTAYSANDKGNTINVTGEGTIVTVTGGSLTAVAPEGTCGQNCGSVFEANSDIKVADDVFT